MRLEIAMAAMMGTAMLAGGCRLAEKAKVRIEAGEWRVELARTEEARRRGLGGREQVPPGTGMLFVFPRERQRSFHMLDCRVPLDLAFISAGGTVVGLHTMDVEPDPARPRNHYNTDPRHDARFALEVPAGELERAGVRVGSKAVFLGAARDAAKDGA
jgi:uncharacterized membrane protein (UPF0127 family)